jgi:hypothetical protein
MLLLEPSESVPAVRLQVMFSALTVPRTYRTTLFSKGLSPGRKTFLHRFLILAAFGSRLAALSFDLVADSLFAVMALARCPGVDRQALAQAVDVLVRTQNAGGGWANDRVSAYNVAALEEAAAAGVPSAGTAYKRGARYLTRHGIPTVTREGLVRIARAAVRQPIPDDGLARCLASAAQL